MESELMEARGPTDEADSHCWISICLWGNWPQERPVYLPHTVVRSESNMDRLDDHAHYEWNNHATRVACLLIMTCWPITNDLPQLSQDHLGFDLSVIKRLWSTHISLIWWRIQKYTETHTHTHTFPSVHPCRHDCINTFFTIRIIYYLL